MLSLLFAFASSIVGGYTSVPVNSEHVQSAVPFLDRNVPLLFPEAQNQQYQIVSAHMQIVNGYNLQLAIKVGQNLIFRVTLYVTFDQKIRLTNLVRPRGEKPLLGGYVWQNPNQFSDNQIAGLVRLIQKENDLLIPSPKVLIYRTQITNGVNQHVVIKDDAGTVGAAVLYKKAGQDETQLISFNLIK